MAITVKLPTQLRDATGGAASAEVDGGRLRIFTRDGGSTVARLVLQGVPLADL